ncbi:hypothetical protein C4564_04800 [Candidatus Microgenomates bacterium]|nr:MAG: hypothetical protein C4564_04800 [Candidatus Microgenomates bacterium]
MNTKKKKIAIVTLVAAVVVLIIGLILRGKSTLPEFTGTAPEWNGIALGQDGEDKLKEVLGDPTHQAQVGEDRVRFEFDSPSHTRDSEALVESGKVTFINRVVVIEEGITLDTIIEEYGQPELTMYGEMSSFNYRLYAYPSKGIATEANDSARDVLNIWYFTPKTTDDFIGFVEGRYYTSPQPHGF